MNTKHLNLKHLITCLLVLLVFSFVSCNENPKNNSEAVQKEVQAKTDSKPEAKTVAYASGVGGKKDDIETEKKEGDDDYIVYYYDDLKDNIRKEVYGDKNSFDMPRVQFIGKFPEGAENNTIWSVKVDGTDLRLVLDEEEIYTGRNGVIHNTPIRSLDNRYIAWVDSGDVVIFDLKTRERSVVGFNEYFPNMVFTHDSKKLIFDSSKGVTEYHVETKKTELVDQSKTPKHIFYNTCRIHPKTGDIYITGVNKKKEKKIVAILNNDWSLKKEFIISAAKNEFFISPDGKKLISYGNSSNYLFNFDKGKKIKEFKSKGSGYIPFTPDSKDYFFSRKGYLVIHDLETDAEDKISYIPFYNYELSLINYID